MQCQLKLKHIDFVSVVVQSRSTGQQIDEPPASYLI